MMGAWPRPDRRGNQTLYGEAPGKGNRKYNKWFMVRGVAFSGNYRYEVDNGYFKVYNSSGSLQGTFTIAVQKDAPRNPTTS